MFKAVIIYYIIINKIGVLVNIIDKHKAKKNKWRIPESTLWAVAIVGGALGTYITMKLIHHKTRKKSFMTFIPIFAIVQVALLVLLYFKV